MKIEVQINAMNPEFPSRTHALITNRFIKSLIYSLARHLLLIFSCLEHWDKNAKCWVCVDSVSLPRRQIRHMHKASQNGALYCLYFSLKLLNIENVIHMYAFTSFSLWDVTLFKWEHIWHFQKSMLNSEKRMFFSLIWWAPLGLFKIKVLSTLILEWLALVQHRDLKYSQLL